MRVARYTCAVSTCLNGPCVRPSVRYVGTVLIFNTEDGRRATEGHGGRLMLLAAEPTERVIGLAHGARLHMYLRMSDIRIGLLLNFNAPRLVDGLRRYIL